jgi:myo-inositol 2-dehydrogenase/D-chiro-inositol 1-dehydrogenase
MPEANRSAEGPGSRPIRVLMASAVRHARDYAAAISARTDFNLVAISEDVAAGERAMTEARALAQAHSVPVVPLAQLDAADLDLAVVCTEPTRHAQVAIELLGRDLHLLIDKPLATTLTDGLLLGAAAAASHRHCAVVNRARSGPVQRLRRLVEDGELGLPRSIDIEFLASSRHVSTSVERLDLVADPQLSGGGELMNFLGYAVDLLREVTGCEPIDVMAETAAAFSETHRQYGVEDLAIVSIGCTNGLTATVTVGRVPAAPGRTPVVNSVRLLGSHGSIALDTETTGVRFHGADGVERELPLPGYGPDPITATLDDAAEMVRADRPPPYGIDDAIIALATIEAAYEAAQSGRVVTVEPSGSPCG